MKVCGLLWCYTGQEDQFEKFVHQARDYWEALHPHTLGGSYINFMMEKGQDRIKATYGDNYTRLQKVKAKYDPDNFFRVNQNIKPNILASDE